MIKNISYLTGLLFFVVSCVSNRQEFANISNTPVYQTSLQQKPIQKTAKPDEGKSVYLTYCLSCHQKDGSGVPGMYPPLQKSDWVNGDKKRIINILINGLEGDIEVNGEMFSSVMPKQNYLTNRQISQVLSYVRQNLGNSADSVRMKDVMIERKEKK
jgi:mono/diheme cytochrome c family protein